jgi:hypothetical protein
MTSTFGLAGHEPIIVLTFPHSGSEALSDLLASSGTISCTARTGLLPMCHSVASTWQCLDQRRELTALAVSSIRALVTSMAVTHAADSGASRWCETSVNGPGPAATFLKAFPKTSFICLHRRCDEAISAALRSHSPGSAETADWPGPPADRENNLATLCMWWAESTRALLDFQRAHPRSSLPLRREDLDADDPGQLNRVWSFLRLDAPDTTIRPRRHPAPAESAPRTEFSADRLPSQVRTVINELHSELGYSPLLPEAGSRRDPAGHASRTGL